MIKNALKIGGVYLVIDPSLQKELLLEKLILALEGGVSMVQVWNNWSVNFTKKEKEQLIVSIHRVTQKFNVPLLINQEWKLLKNTGMEGIHFDDIPQNFDRIKSEIKKPFIAGITCSNNLETIQWAETNNLDYVSFCSVYPSASVSSCEIVKEETIIKARQITQMPVFLSGGINIQNIEKLNKYDFQGVAVISGILNSESPKQSASDYNKNLKDILK
ncbi:thiamine phosphate synthase [Abyssalbus ytuae]|uniref:Thiamine phosphate synthase n=1 Tax=Abyssalbus ytuae TaxID=2926907 RepID=A0A9E6ZSR4_9FLAO|nr:thiamine phosphate synthase [Abyssalbus ytuae]UOB17173.1 thiamine phosphate synthase [Abyssalbus ytuae]